MSGNGTKYTKADKAEKIAKAMELYAQRKPMAHIAKEIGVCHKTASDWIQNEYNKISAPIIEAERKRDLDLIQQAIELCWSRIQAKDSQHSANFGDLDKLLARRAKLMGLDAPEKVAVEHTESVSPAIMERINEVRAKNSVLEMKLNQLSQDNSDV